ncbi:hypothetical protein [Lactobacillus terrae]|uniref:hypothetical protein n=1 Tax=Lactobacillus terrae TaxID=2269374 RepID=UPI000C1B6930|nr:hypothetical protein [Lactobacillus terrae]
MKNKKIIAGIIAIIVLIIVIFIFKGFNSTNFMKDVKVEYSGYENRGTATVSSESKLAALKKVANYEGKKAKVDSKTMNAIIDKAESVSDLNNEDNFNTATMSSEEVINAGNYLEHMKETYFTFNKSYNLKNGQTIRLRISDFSDKPYFKAITKTYKVSELKKVESINVSSIEKNLVLEPKGTNHHGDVTIKYSKDATPNLRSINWNEIFDMPVDKSFMNGDKITISEKKLASELNNKKDKYHFVGDKNKKVTLKVENLKNNIGRADNLSAVIKEVTRSGADEKVISICYVEDHKELQVISKTEKGIYYQYSYDNCILKNNKIMAYGPGNEKLVNFEDITWMTMPMITDIKTDAEATQPSGKGNVIDFEI